MPEKTFYCRINQFWGVVWFCSNSKRIYRFADFLDTLCNVKKNPGKSERNPKKNKYKYNLKRGYWQDVGLS